LIKKQGIIYSTIPFVWLFFASLYFGYRNRLLRAVLNAGQTIYALGHVRWIGLAAIQFEHRLRADVHTRAVAIALVCIDRYHVHDYAFLLLSVVALHYSAPHVSARAKNANAINGRAPIA
jgi:hypothetical protein